MLQLKVQDHCIHADSNRRVFICMAFSIALLINDDSVSWAVAGDQIIITLQGIDIAKIK